MGASSRPQFLSPSDRARCTSSRPTLHPGQTSTTAASGESLPTSPLMELQALATPIPPLATHCHHPDSQHHLLCWCQARPSTIRPLQICRLTGPPQLRACQPTTHQPQRHLSTSEVRTRTQPSRALMGTHILCLATRFSFPAEGRARMDRTTRQS